MQVLVSELSYSEKCDFYDNLRRSVLGYKNSATYPTHLLMDWDNTRLKLFPNATQMKVEKSEKVIEIGANTVEDQTVVVTCKDKDCPHNEKMVCTRKKIMINQWGCCDKGR